MNSINTTIISKKVSQYSLDKLTHFLDNEIICFSSCSGGTTFRQSVFYLEDKVNLFFKDSDYKVNCMSIAIDLYNSTEYYAPQYDIKFTFSDGKFNMEDLHLFTKGMKVNASDTSMVIKKIEIYGLKYDKKTQFFDEDEEASMFHGFPTLIEDKKNFNHYQIDMDSMILFISSDNDKILVKSTDRYRIMQVVVDNKEIDNILNQIDIDNLKIYALQHIIE